VAAVQGADVGSVASSRLREAEAALAAADRWAAAVEATLPNLVAQLAASADIVAATTATISTDPHFGENSALFDLLIVENADRITETEFLRASRRAHRWVLVGEMTCDSPVRGDSKPVLPAALRPGFFQRLWDNLHAHPGRFPCTWRRQSDGRLCCRLRALSADDRRHIETEHVADRPDVELRIVTSPRAAPELAEVVFPRDTSAAEAKAYLFSELDELTIQSSSRILRWLEEADRILLHMADAEPGFMEEIAIAPGVTELIGPSRVPESGESPPFLTYGLIFHRAAGWSRESAEEWTNKHLDARDLGRTAFLGTSHRMRPMLARIVASVFTAEWGVVTPGDDRTAVQAPAVEFIAVPSYSSEPQRRNESDVHRRGGGMATATRQRPVKGGAGLETDLGEPRRPDALPNELRDALPAQGLVNYLEARAVVNELEMLVTDAGFCTEVERWRQLANGHKKGPAIGVIALYSAQAELIRHLVARVPVLCVCPLTIEIGTPDQFQQRECVAALVSLTRSHLHRPVSFGDGPPAFSLALTRARARLLLFGDPGTLARRSQCFEPVDHLDPAAAARERSLIANLVASINGHGDRPAITRQRQGSAT
jgi:hypothetical protein